MKNLEKLKIFFQKINKSKFLVLLVISICVFLVYHPTFKFDYTYLDDYDLVVKKNHIYLDIKNIPILFTTKFFMTDYGAYYRPLISFSFMIDAKIGGTRPFIYHFSNLIYHILGSFLFFLLLRKFVENYYLVFALTLLFIVHPLNVQTAVWIPGRNDSILFIFVALSFLYYFKITEKNSIFYHVIFSLSFLSALLSKENAILIIPGILIYYFLFKKKLGFSKNFTLVLIETMILTIGWLILQSKAKGGVIISEGLELKFLDYILGILNYTGKTLLPLNLSVITLKDNLNEFYGILVLIFIVILSIKGIKNKKIFYFGFIWYLMFLVSGMVGYAGFTNFLDNRAYVPHFGFALMIAQYRFFDKAGKYISITIFVIMVIYFLFITLNYISNFRDGITFYTSAIKSSPESFFTRRGLANVYHRKGMYDDAEKEFLKSLSLNPNSIETLNNIAINYRKMNKPLEAERYLLRAIELNPENKITLNNLANLYLSMNKYEESEKLFLKSISLDSSYYEAYNNLGVLYARIDKDSLALFNFKKSIKLNPFFMEAYLNLSIYFFNKGDIDSGRYYYKLALKNGLNPDNPLQKLMQ